MARALVWFEREVLERRWALGCLLLVVYIPTASYTFLSPDVIGAEIPAWSLATRGTLSFPHHPNPTVPWFFEYEGRFYSDRFPGAILFLVPGYFLAGLLGTDGFSVNPGAISAAVVTAAAILVMDEVYGVTLGSTRAKHVATLFTAFGTGAWSICANAPWSHTLNFLLLALVLSALARDRLGWAGLALGGVVFTRPQWLVAAAVLALVLGVLRRSPTPVARIALGTIPGVVALFAYNGLMFGRWGPSNGHELSGTIQPHWEAVPWNVAGAVLSPSRGLIVYYPIVLIALVGLRPAIRNARPWEIAAALAGIAGMLVQLLLNRYSGGDTFFGPRLWIEPLALLAPLLARAVQTVWTERPGTMLIPAALIIGVVIHGVGAVLMPY